MPIYTAWQKPNPNRRLFALSCSFPARAVMETLLIKLVGANVLLKCSAHFSGVEPRYPQDVGYGETMRQEAHCNSRTLKSSFALRSAQNLMKKLMK